MRLPLDPLSRAVDTFQRWTVDWYAWLIELAGVVTELQTSAAGAAADITALQTDVTNLQLSVLIGTVTFVAATTAAVTFGAAEADANYKIVVDSPEDNYFWTTAKTVNGFTLNAKNSTSVTVSWILMR